MKPFAIAFGKRVILIAGDLKQLVGVEVCRNPSSNLVLVKKGLDT